MQGERPDQQAAAGEAEGQGSDRERGGGVAPAFDSEALVAVELSGLLEAGLQIGKGELLGVVVGWRTRLDDDDSRLFAVRFEEGCSLGQAATTLGWSEIRVRKRDTALRAGLLNALRSAGFLEKARVKIGSSLLARRANITPSPASAAKKES